MSSMTAPSRLVAEDAPTDDEVVRRIRAGEGSAFEILMRRYNQRLFRVARAIVRDDAEAEDVMQQAYVNAYLHLDQFEGRARFSTWIVRIATYEALARLRRRSRRQEIDVMPESQHAPRAFADTSADPERQAMTTELRRTIEAALDALPEIYRTTFVLRDVEGLSTAETAACLAVTEDVVKTRLSRARSLLRAELLGRAGVASAEVFAFHAVRCDRVVQGVLDRLGLTTVVH